MCIRDRFVFNQHRVVLSHVDEAACLNLAPNPIPQVLAQRGYIQLLPKCVHFVAQKVVFVAVQGQGQARVQKAIAHPAVVHC
eukprot:15144994-Alexandrium_andersonii.AAC.1